MKRMWINQPSTLQPFHNRPWEEITFWNSGISAVLCRRAEIFTSLKIGNLPWDESLIERPEGV